MKGGTLSPDAGHRPAVRPGHVPELGGAEKSTSRDGASELEDSEVGEDQREASRYPFDCSELRLNLHAATDYRCDTDVME